MKLEILEFLRNNESQKLNAASVCAVCQYYSKMEAVFGERMCKLLSGMKNRRKCAGRSVTMGRANSTAGPVQLSRREKNCVGTHSG